MKITFKSTMLPNNISYEYDPDWEPDEEDEEVDEDDTDIICNDIDEFAVDITAAYNKFGRQAEWRMEIEGAERNTAWLWEKCKGTERPGELAKLLRLMDDNSWGNADTVMAYYYFQLREWDCDSVSNAIDETDWHIGNDENEAEAYAEFGRANASDDLPEEFSAFVDFEAYGRDTCDKAIVKDGTTYVFREWH